VITCGAVVNCISLALYGRFNILAATTCLMILAAAFVASQPLFDTDRRLFGAVIGIRGHSFGFQQCARIEMYDALGPEPESVPAHRCMPRIAAAKIFRGCFFDTISDFSLSRRADNDISTRDTQRHCLPPLGLVTLPLGRHKRFQRRSVPRVNALKGMFSGADGLFFAAALD